MFPNISQIFSNINIDFYFFLLSLIKQLSSKQQKNLSRVFISIIFCFNLFLRFIKFIVLFIQKYTHAYMHTFMYMYICTCIMLLNRDISKHFSTTRRQLKLSLQVSLETWSFLQILFPTGLLDNLAKKHKLTKHNEARLNI